MVGKMMNKDRMGGKEGFTLPEALVGVAILTTSLVVIIASMKAYLDIVERAQNVTLATFETQAALEERIQISGTQANPLLASSFDRKKNGKYVCRTAGYFNGLSLMWDERVSVSWKEGNALIGEDRDLDGRLDTTPAPSEDANGNGKLDSPVAFDVPVPRSRW